MGPTEDTAGMLDSEFDIVVCEDKDCVTHSDTVHEVPKLHIENSPRK
jgi:hypothetical protein